METHKNSCTLVDAYYYHQLLCQLLYTYMSRRRAWCFTKNNPDEPPAWDATIMKYMVYQFEEGEEKTPHFQGYVYFKGARSLGSVRKLLSGCHLTPAEGSAMQNRVYCTKELGRLADPHEYGEIPQQGKRSDLMAVAKTIENDGLDAAIELAPSMYMKYKNGFKAYNSWLLTRKRKRIAFIRPKIRVYYGPTRAGKTRHCYEKYPDLYEVASHSGGKLWMCGYEGEETVLFDDFCGGIPFKLLLQLTGGYPTRLEYKGGHIMLLATTILFTSNTHPETWYQKAIANGLDQAPWCARLEEFGKIRLYPKTQ